MTALYTHRYVLRATIEFTTPFLVSCGHGGDIADAVFVSDANGLPAIPGSSLAGILRAAFRVHGELEENRLFGFQSLSAGEGSRLRVSWACIHDSHDTPLEGIVPPDRLNDPVLAKAMSPGIRDHVRINHRGTSDAEERGKFDEQAVCAGHHFTFELELAGTEAHQGAWRKLLATLADPTLRLGGKTRRGFGAFRILRGMARARVFDLRKDFEAYEKHPVSLSASSPALHEFALPPAESKTDEIVVQLKLKPAAYWMFGGGQDPEGQADMAGVRDCRVLWENGQGRIEENVVVIPATAVKGALSHRVAFHFNRLTGAFVENLGGGKPADVTGENNPAVRELFGFCKKKMTQGGDEKEGGQRGRIVMDDLYINGREAPPSNLVHHVGIDRFTGGARDQVLFSERPFWQGREIPITVRILESSRVDDANVKKALALTLDDLAQGRLQLGAGCGRGNGYFIGSATWPTGKNWING